MSLVGQFEHTVLMERHLFALIEDAPGNDDPFTVLPAPLGFLAREGNVVVESELADQEARVRVEIWDSTPETPRGTFIAMGEAHQVRFESERIQLINIMREPAGEAHELASPGPYSVCLFRSPQEENPSEPLEAFRNFERFVIQIWNLTRP
ncbi:hypothetical protein OG754_01085 [Streptomyces decoyicus]|uniref:hypothetical protein n=1 Tax=Streptomyces decoyicus TaxID=249567 RepID=UPI002E312681|nr:hypothetical protein [Streptomyces decoyicus]